MLFNIEKLSVIIGKYTGNLSEITELINVHREFTRKSQRCGNSENSVNTK